jgi:hypothetical protein
MMAFLAAAKAADDKKIDIERARHLMDPQLLRDAERELIKAICPNGFNPFDIAICRRSFHLREDDARFIWGAYCRLHKSKYGEPFAPDIDPNHWD